MKVRLIKTESDYEAACSRIYELINATESLIIEGSEEGDELELLSFLVEKYEQEKGLLGMPTPVDAIKFRMDQMNLKQVDIAPLFGGSTRVSEVLNGKRRLTLKMIKLLNKYLGIPLESLLGNNKEIILDVSKRKALLSISSIKSYLEGSKIAIF